MFSNNLLIKQSVNPPSFFFFKGSYSNCSNAGQAYFFVADQVLQQLCNIDSRHPTVVYGSSGKGKTALMAKIIGCFQQPHKSVVVYRFLGTSPHSSHIDNTLKVKFRN